MKQTMKRLMAVVLTAVMMLSMAVTAFGAEAEPPATITVNAKDEKHLLTGKDFQYYQLLTATLAKDEGGKVISIGWEVNDKYYNILKAVTKKEDKKEIIEYIESLKKTTDAETAAATRSFADAVRAELVKQEAPGKDGSLTVAEDGMEATAKVPYGYYLIRENSNDSTTESSAVSLAMLDNATPDFERNEKAEYPAVDKSIVEDEEKVDSIVEEVGTIVTFRYDTKVPDLTSYTEYKYIFHDTMDTGLAFDIDSVTVKIGNTTLSKADTTSDFEVLTDELGDDCTFHVTLDLLALKTKYENAVVTGADIIVTYTAKITNDAVMVNENEVKLEYNSNPYDSDETDTTPEDKVTVYTLDINVLKVDKDINDDGNHDMLSGAKFAVFTSEEDAKTAAAAQTPSLNNAISFFQKENNTAKIPGSYIKDDGTVTDSVRVTTKELEVSGAELDKGKLHIEGLEEATYYLVETKAPDGYNRLKTPIKVTVSKSETGEGETLVVSSVVKVDDAEDAQTDNNVTVENSKGVILPETGGMGTTILYAAGIIAMAGAIFYFTMNRKKKED